MNPLTILLNVFLELLPRHVGPEMSDLPDSSPGPHVLGPLGESVRGARSQDDLSCLLCPSLLITSTVTEALLTSEISLPLPPKKAEKKAPKGSYFQVRINPDFFRFFYALFGITISISTNCTLYIYFMYNI